MSFREALAEHLTGRFIYGMHREAVHPDEIKDVDVQWDEGETSDNEDYSPRLPALRIEVVLTDNSRVTADPGWMIAALLRNLLGARPVPEELPRYADGHYNTDTRCPYDGEMVNYSCWRCKWERDADERMRTVTTLFAPLPADHRPVAVGKYTHVIGGCTCGIRTPGAATEFATHIRMVR